MDFEKKYKRAFSIAQSSYNIIPNEEFKKQLAEMFPELESEDERIRKEILSFVKEFEYDHYRNLDFRSWIAWLEKQGEKPQGKSIIEAWKDMRLEVYQQASGNRHEPNYSDDSTKMFSLNDIDEIIEKINEQTGKVDNQNCVKPADKVEPKFKVGDWASTTQPEHTSPVQIVDKDNVDYRIEDTNGNSGAPSIEWFDKVYHPWTIKDAKDGDVLQFSESHYILVKQIVDNKLISYADLVGDELRVCQLTFDLDFYPLNPWYPAPSAHRIKLLSELRKAGYKIDYKKDDLVKLDKPIIEAQGKISASKYPDGSIQISGLSEGQCRIIMSLIESWS